LGKGVLEGTLQSPSSGRGVCVFLTLRLQIARGVLTF
jgi:hypothetical protein